MKTRRLIAAACFTVLLCCFQCESAFALDPAKTLNQYVHDSWGTKDGLPASTINAILQTRDGYLWLGTPEGLVRFDGVRFITFDRRSTKALLNLNIRTLYEDRAGALWIGTDGGGVSRLMDGQWTTFTTENGIANNGVWAITEDRAGNIWFGTRGGLNSFRDGKFTLYTTADGLSHNSVRAICEDREGALWVGTPNGLNKFQDGKWTSVSDEQSKSDSVLSIYPDRDGVMWVGVDSRNSTGALVRIKNGKATRYVAEDAQNNAGVLAINGDRDGNLWIGVSAFKRWRDGIISDSILKLVTVWSIYEDQEGSLWVGTGDQGLHRFKDGRFTPYTTEEGLLNLKANSVYEDREGIVWIGTEHPGGALSKFKAGKFIHYSQIAGLPLRPVIALYEDGEGNLWIGTYLGGLIRMKDGRFTNYKRKFGPQQNIFWAINEDEFGNLWVGTESGLCRFRDGTFTTYTTADGLLGNSVRSIHKDRIGDLWIGTSGGLNRLRDGQLTSYTIKDGLAGGVVLTIHEDREGTLWIGTRGGGLSRFRDGRFQTCTTAAGLFDDIVNRILEDDAGYLWMSGDKGISRISKHELNDYFDGRAPAVTHLSYNEADGLKSAQTYGGAQPAGWKTRDGKLWFPTNNGVAVIDPLNYTTNRLPPPVVIEEIDVDQTSINIRKQAQLPAGSERLEFHYTALSFLAPEKVHFKYRLEGFDHDWIDAGTARTASYTNLPPGDYKFRVIAANNDGVWNAQGAAFDFRLNPYFHQTVWFYALCAAATGLMILVFYRLRVRQVKRQFGAVLAERTRIAREFHDTLAQGFVGISVQLEYVAEMLRSSPDAAEEYLDRARLTVRGSLAEARRSIHNLRAHGLESYDLPTAFSEMAAQLTDGTGVKFELQVHGASRQLSETLENNLYRIGQEALTNAVKHAGAGRIRLSLSYGEKDIQLLVRDNGRGFDAESAAANGGGRGFGVRGIRERVEELGGQLALRSRPGEGTEVEVHIPIG